MGTTYKAEIDVDPDTPCACGDDSCWKGRARELREIEDCALDPGDPSPAGRCPLCDSLAYVVQEGPTRDSRFQLVLDLSTSHMPSTSPEWGGLRVVEHEYGYVVFVAGEPTEEALAAEPEWIRPVMLVARAADCTMVNFDQAGEQVDDLPTWEW